MKTMKTFMVAVFMAILCTVGYTQKTAFDYAGTIPSASERKAYVRNLPPAERVAVWTEQLDYAINTEKFTTVQFKFVREVQTYLDVKYFDGTEKFPQELTDRAKDIFKYNLPLYRRTFDIPNNKVLPDVINPCERPKSNDLRPVCECYWGWSCPTRTSCVESGSNYCQRTTNCGIFGTAECTGLCLEVT